MCDRISLILPWPDPKLSPNARIHYREKAAHVKSARRIGFFLAKEQPQIDLSVGPLLLRLIFRPPSGRRRDADNLLASCKAYLDGIFDALCIDDCRVKKNNRRDG